MSAIKTRFFASQVNFLGQKVNIYPSNLCQKLAATKIGNRTMFFLVDFKPLKIYISLILFSQS